VNFSTLSWFGRGPQESYTDRKAGYALGIHTEDVFHPVNMYVRPQEYGNKIDVRWAAWTNPQGTGLAAIGQPHLYASAWPYTTADLEAPWHPHALPQRDTITVNIDAEQMGIGARNSWGALPLAWYTLQPNRTYQWQVRLVPVVDFEKNRDSVMSRLLPDLQ